MKDQRGFLLVAATVLLTLMMFFVVTAAYISTNDAKEAANQGLTTQALYLAEAGMARGMTDVANTNTASRVSCATVNGSGIYTQNLGGGSFTVTGTSYNPTSTTLSAALDNASLIIPATSVSGYAASGAIRIGGEIINYGGVGTSTSVCGGAISTCFLAQQRGVGGTYATAHASGRTISQNMCQLSSVGSVPASNPAASRTLTNNVMYAETTNIWLSGAASSGELIMRWNGEVWNRQALSNIPNTNLNAMYFNSSTDGWVVGNSVAAACSSPASNGVFGHWNGTSWSQVCSVATVISTNLQGVHCLSSSSCVAAATPVTLGTTDPVFGLYAASTWSQDNDQSAGPQGNRVRSVTVNDVFMISSSLAFAVGDNWTGTQPGEMIFNWDSTKWYRSTAQASIADQNMHGIHCPSATRCWVVGDGGTIATWAGSGTTFSGATGTSPFTVNANVNGLALNDVFCMSTSDCWAVGNASSGVTVVRYNGGTNTWSRDTTNIDSSVLSTINLTKVFCDTTSTCWAVGADASNNGYALYWNGTVWVDWSGGIINASPVLQPIAVAGTTPLPSGPLLTNSYRQFVWQELVN